MRRAGQPGPGSGSAPLGEGCVFFLVDGAFFAAKLPKVPDGGWFPLLVGFVIFVALTTWSRGRKLMIDRMREAAMPMRIFIDSAVGSATRVPGRARSTLAPCVCRPRTRPGSGGRGS